MRDYQSARLNMVDSQVRPNKVSDLAVLEAMLTVPREAFVPEHLRGIAYVDEDVPLGKGRFLIEPMIFGRMLQVAAVTREDVVLDVGCATGYSSAVLARLARNVIALEEDGAMAQAARSSFASLGLANVALIEGKLAAGYAQRAPYNVIVVNGAVAALPEAITAQLAEGGRLVAVVRPDAGMGKLVLATRVSGVVGHRVVCDAGTPMLPAFAKQPSFVF